jgi:hypothetical protein
MVKLVLFKTQMVAECMAALLTCTLSILLRLQVCVLGQVAAGSGACSPAGLNLSGSVVVVSRINVNV